MKPSLEQKYGRTGSVSSPDYSVALSARQKTGYVARIGRYEILSKTKVYFSDPGWFTTTDLAGDHDRTVGRNHDSDPSGRLGTERN